MSGRESSRQRSPYRIIKKLGSGSFGTVYEGVHCKSGEQVALKMIGTSVRKEFIQLECKNNQHVKKLGPHPNIIGFLGDYKIRVQATIRHVFVLEYAKGGDLFHRLSQMGSFSEADTRDIIRDVLLGLYHLHSNRMVHRDIKPANILFRTNGSPGTAALSDLGLALRIPPGTVVDFNAAGTLVYCPPEAFRYNLVGRRGDIWPVGVIMHELLLGQHPFCTDYPPDNTKAIYKIVHLELNFKSDVYSHVSSDGLDFMSKLLRKNANHRLKAREALNHPWFGTAPEERHFTIAELSRTVKREALKLAACLPANPEKQRRNADRWRHQRKIAYRKRGKGAGRRGSDDTPREIKISPLKRDVRPSMKVAGVLLEGKLKDPRWKRQQLHKARILRRPSTKECKVLRDSSDYKGERGDRGWRPVLRR